MDVLLCCHRKIMENHSVSKYYLLVTKFHFSFYYDVNIYFFQNKWSYCGLLKVGRASPAVAAAGGYLYVMGGDQTHEVNFYRAQVTIASVERYDPEKGVWEDSSPLPDSRSEAAAIVL